jgi:methyl-accepting chemotaxis protein
LAQRATDPAKEIKTFTGDSVSKVAEESDLVNHAGVTMKDIVGSAQNMTFIMGKYSMPVRKK